MPNKPTTLAALLIKPDGPIERITIERGHDDGAHLVHELIGNYFTSFFGVPGHGSRNRMLVGYCDDDGLRAEPVQWNLVVDGTLRQAPEWIAGPIVIMAHDGPDSASMTELEMAAFHVLEPIPRGGRVLTFRPGFDVGR